MEKLLETKLWRDTLNHLYAAIGGMLILNCDMAQRFTELTKEFMDVENKRLEELEADE